MKIVIIQFFGLVNPMDLNFCFLSFPINRYRITKENAINTPNGGSAVITNKLMIDMDSSNLVILLKKSIIILI